MQQERNPTDVVRKLQAMLPPAAPQNRAELDALLAKRSELGSQLQSVTERRREVAEQLRTSDRTAQSDLQSRLKVLDARSARLESEILKADDGIADALASGITPEPSDPFALLNRAAAASAGVQPRQQVGQVVATTMFVEAVGFVLLGFVLWQFYFKRAAAKFARPAVDSSNRLDQLQNAVDSIAVEVERISENQRYVTKVLNEKLQPAIGAGEAQHIPAKGKSATPVRTSDSAP